MTRQHPARAADDAAQAEIIGGEVSCGNGSVRHDRPLGNTTSVERISIRDELSPAPSTYRKDRARDYRSRACISWCLATGRRFAKRCDKNAAQAVLLRRALA